MSFEIIPWILPFLLLLQPVDNQNKSFMQAGFKVDHHCFKSFGQPAIEVVSF